MQLVSAMVMVVGVGLLGCTTARDETNAAREAVIDVLHKRIEAIRTKNAEAATATLSPTIIAFEMLPPLSLPPGSAADVDSLAAWLAGWQDIDVHMQDLVVHASGDVAFAHSLHRLSGTMIDGRTLSIWMRSTVGLRKENGRWKIVHAHTSVPVRPDGKAAFDLEP
jgi:ketosteroid isomerase-like protein